MVFYAYVASFVDTLTLNLCVPRVRGQPSGQPEKNTVLQSYLACCVNESFTEDDDAAGDIYEYDSDADAAAFGGDER